MVFHLVKGVWEVLAGGQGSSPLGVVRVEVSPEGELVWLERSLEVLHLYLHLHLYQVEGSPYPGPHGAALRVMAKRAGEEAR